MEKQESFILKAYIREHIKGFIIYVLIIGILLGVAKLYYYEDAVSNMSYAVILITFFGAVYGIWGYIRYRKRCIMLLNAMPKGGERSFYLPDSIFFTDKLYRELITVMEEEERDLVTEYDEKKQDMTDYYTMWTHQIKTPISALRLLVQDDKKQQEELFKIEQYSEMALHYARLDSLSSDLVFQRQDVYEMIKYAVKKNYILFSGKHLSFHLDEFSIHAVTDEKWLTFVIEQVLSNALKYTTEGGISIYGLDEDRKVTNGEASYIVIEDTGIGIRQEDLPRIFERGFTGYNGRLDKKSTGIGLYLCRQIMDRLSHTIQVESHIGQGTKVTLGFVQKTM